MKVLSVKMLCHFEFAHLKKWSGWMENCLNFDTSETDGKLAVLKRVSGSCDTYLLGRERHRLRKERVDRNSLFLTHVNYHDHDF